MAFMNPDGTFPDGAKCPVTLGPACLGFLCLGCGRRTGSYVLPDDDDPAGTSE